jgi:vacuolar-type H+-ATPase subunit D/Vma8
LDITKKFKIFLKSKWVSGLHCVLSFLNLGWSVYELRETFKKVNVVKQYENRLEKIRTSFNSHKLGLGILPDDSKESIAKIMEVYNNIREDQKELQNLMEDILKSIKIQEFQQKKAAGLTVSSVALGAAGVAGTILTGGTTTAIYGISTVVNAISAVVNGTNIYMSMEIVKNLNDILKRAIELNKEIQDTIDNLINEINKRIEIEPKFNLNESNSSISTNI